MQEETIATVKLYLNDLDTLQRRWDEASAQKNADVAREQLTAAKAAIDHGRTLGASAPTKIAAAAKTNADALIKENDNLLHDLALDIEIANENLVAFETRTNAVAFAPSTPVANPTPTTPEPTPGTPPDHATNISCDAEIALECPEGQVDACMKDPKAESHACVPK